LSYFVMNFATLCGSGFYFNHKVAQRSPEGPQSTFSTAPMWDNK